VDMNRHFSVTPSEKRALAVATLAAIIFGAYFLRHYFSLIIFAAIMAFLFNPFYKRRLKKNKNPGRAAATTFVFGALAILLPLMVILLLTVVQINHSINQISTTVQNLDVTTLSQHIINTINNFLARTPVHFRLSAEWIQATTIELVQKISSEFLRNLAAYAGSFFSFFTTAIIFIFVFLSLLKNQESITETFRSLNPLGEEISDLYLSSVSAMTKAMVRGQFIIALAQGFTDAALIYIGGLHTAFFFLLMILTTLSFIPLGGGIIAIPIGVAMILTGNAAGGLIVILGHLLIVTNIDNILRPKLVPSEAKLDSALMILSVFSGIALLGFLGIVVGPVIMIIIITTINVYREVYKNVSVEKDLAGAGRIHKRSFWQRLWSNKKIA
jgi:predicted PurR-regulated permease PerM